MKLKILSLCLFLCLLLPVLIACGGEDYPQKASTKEELTAVLSFDGTEVPYEMFRAFFLNYKAQVEEDTEGGFQGENAEEAWNKIMPLVLDDLAEIYAIFALCERYGIDPYSDKIDDALAEEIRISIEGGFYGEYRFEGYGSYDKYLAVLKESGMNDGASRTVLRYHLCEDELLKKLTIPMESAYEYTEHDVNIFFADESCVHVALLYREAASGGMTAAENRERAEKGLRLLRESTSDTERLNYAVQYFSNSPDDIRRGAYISPYAFSFVYRDVINAAYSLEVGEYSDVIGVSAPMQDYYYVVQRLEKYGTDLFDREEDIEQLYLCDRFYRELDAVKTALLEKIAYEDFYHALYGTDIVY